MTAKKKPRRMTDQREDARALIESEGLFIAAKTLIAICEDESAPAQARTAAGVAVFRAGGMFEKREDSSHKEDYELSPAEMLERLEGYKRSNEQFLAQLAEYNAAQGEDDDINGDDPDGESDDDDSVLD